MEEVTFTRQITFDSLGKWQTPILHAIKERLQGSHADYVPLPFGRAGLVVYWDGFEGLTTEERKGRVKEVIDTLGAGVSDKVSISLTLTNAESEDLERSYSGLMKEAALENAPSPQLEVYAMVKRELDSSYTTWYDIVEEALFVNGEMGTVQKTVAFSNAFANRFDEYDKTTEKAIIASVLASAFGMKAPQVSITVEAGNGPVLLTGDGETMKLDVFPNRQ